MRRHPAQISRDCIELFKKIDPEVKAIATYAGGKRDTGYLLKDGKWEAQVAPEVRPKGNPPA